jgi:DNA integrity scanning protein DisA with diadenylate cyclase activity
MIDNPFWTVTLPEMLDVVFVAILLYTAIVWAQQTRAAFVVRGILILGSIYIIAKYLDLQMTAWIFQGFFAIFLIMIVVIFQEELLQLFERIAEKNAYFGFEHLRRPGPHGSRSRQGTRRRVDRYPRQRSARAAYHRRNTSGGQSKCAAAEKYF